MGMMQMKENTTIVKHRACLHLWSFEPESILEMVDPDAEPLFLWIDRVKTKVNMKSLRLQCFKKSTICVGCGRVGTIMSLDKFKAKSKIPSAHFNLYAEKPGGRFVMMTKDHIVPKSKGGAKLWIGNLQTMCEKCNAKKADKIIVEGISLELSYPNNGMVRTGTEK